MSYEENRISDQIDAGLQYQKQLFESGIVLTETSKARVCFVNVPKESYAHDLELEISPEDDFYELSYSLQNTDVDSGFYGDWTSYPIELPPGDWQLLPRLSQVSEEQAAGIMDELYVKDFDSPAYFNYKSGLSKDCLLTATEGILSLARSLNIPEDQDPVVLVEFKK